jgi:hypothetical protein
LFVDPIIKSVKKKKRKIWWLSTKIPSRFECEIMYGIQYQGPRTYSMDNRPSNQFADRSSTELPRKNARKNHFDVSSSVDLRDNCPSALHEIPVNCPVKVG